MICREPQISHDERPAHLDEVLPLRLEPVLLVERRRVHRFGRRDLQKRGDLLHRLRRDPVVLVLDRVQRRQQHRPLRRDSAGSMCWRGRSSFVGEVRLGPLLDDVRAAVFGDPSHGRVELPQLATRQSPLALISTSAAPFATCRVACGNVIDSSDRMWRVLMLPHRNQTMWGGGPRRLTS